MDLMFKNPVNGYIENSPNSWLWCLIFGIFYMIYKQLWVHAIIGVIAALITGGLSWLVYPFFIKKILINNYLSKGWTQV
jgi:hypothetical protein